jgi:UDP-N-acetylmuramate--alanine ligase
MTHVHLIGIGGTGLSAIAMVLLESGYTVSGSDLYFSELAKSVVSAGARFYLGHNPENVEGADIVVRSSAVPDTNVEVKAALTKEVPVLKRSEFVGQLLSDKHTIAVAGTHGKTSTTAMIAWGLTQLKQDPSFILGGVISGLETNAKAGKGEFFVIEADEYDRMFLGLNPEIAVITNIEHDHPDCYPTAGDFSDAFRQFVGRMPPDGVLVACGDDPGTADVVKFAEMSGIKTLTFGRKNLQNNYQAIHLKPDLDQGGYEFYVRQEKTETRMSLKVPGVHNVLNALAALVVFDLIGLAREESVPTLENFQGTGRRFEIIGVAGGVIVISDYAHHPTEIKATLAAARSRYPGREIWAVWQPHTYSRTKLLFHDFVESFADAHHVLVTEVYPSREPIDLDFSAGHIVDEMDHPNAVFVPKLEDAVLSLSSKLAMGDILIVMSAGDADQICSQVLKTLST